ncbi:hypothetical protein [Tenacibaculum sp. 190524A02b]|uniref:hypothetical protein n=1 Tax=Tenacibaculum vairaonense TaxID=3137860 RepID=UPI0032B279C6
MKTKILVIAFLLANFLVVGQENYFDWNKSLGSFQNGLENQVAYINFGDAKLWGYVEVTITGGYGHRLTSGKYTKRFQIAKNPVSQGGYFSHSSEVPTNFGHIGAEWKIGEMEFVDNNLRVPIYHLLKTGNTPRVLVEGLSVVAYDTNNITITSAATVPNNETRDHVTISNLLHVDLNSKSIGVNTTRPGAKFDVNGSLRAGDGNWGALIVNGKDKNDWLFNAHNDGKSFYIRTHSDTDVVNSKYIMSMNRITGNVGIGITYADARLSVSTDKDLIARFQNGDASDKTRGIRLNSKNTQGAVKYFDIAIDAEDEKVGLGIGTSSGNLPIGKTDLAHAQLVIDRKDGGSVGIGTTDTKGFKLGVDGRVAATEVKIAKYENWPDYVFKNTYELPTLSEVENHIKTKGHLQNIPSAKEVEKEGFFLGNMDAKLLEKIEELTLYTIQQEKEIKQLKELKEENKNLKERLDKLEKMVNQFLNK